MSIDLLLTNDILILGDFNTPHFQNLHSHAPDSKTTALLDLQSLLNLNQFNQIQNNNGRILDLVLSNFNISVIQSPDPVVREDVHHPAIEIEIPFAKQTKSRSNDLNKSDFNFNFRKADFHSLYHGLSLINWSSVLNETNIEIALDKFYDCIYHVLKKTVPLKHKSRGNYPVWFDKNIIILIKQKLKLWKQYKRYHSIRDYNEFKILRSTVKKEVAAAHKRYLDKICSQIKDDPKQFWTYLNQNNKNKSLPSTFFAEGVTIDTPECIVDAFANYFSKSFSSLKANIPDDHSFTSTDLLSTPEFKVTDVIKAIRQLKPNLNMGPDEIPAFIVRDCVNIFAEPLCSIFNLILTTSVFPNKWKLSRLIPVFKKGDKANISNYRPISIICNFAKVFESVLYSYLYGYVSSKLTTYQHGFMSKRSTVTNLTCQTQTLCETLDTGGQVDVVYIDFAKAFDTINHRILLRKLDKLGFSPNLLTLITNYLTDRYQYVQLWGVKSRNFIQSSGVPQGSVLGPLFFNVFINDLSLLLKDKHLFFADDLKTSEIIKSQTDCELLQARLNCVVAWCKTNLLYLNTDKCSILTFTRKTKVIDYNYYIDDYNLARSSTIKDLGVTFDSKLSFNEHANVIRSSALKSLGVIIRQSKELKSIEVLKSLYYAFVRSRLEYASVVWNPYYNEHTSNLENVQRRFAKLLYFISEKHYPPIGIPHVTLLDKYQITQLKTRRIYFSTSFVRKILNNSIDCGEVLRKLQFAVPSYNSRQTYTFYLPRASSNMMKSSPVYQMCLNCNKISSKVDIFNCTENEIKKAIDDLLK